MAHALLTLSFPCPVCENATMADIVFLVDGSSSIGHVSFEEVRYFVCTIIKALDIGPNKVQVGFVQYSGDPYQEFLLKDYTDKKSLLAAVEKIPYRQGGTNTGKAIDFLLRQHFTKEAGSRASQQVPQVALVITDGGSSDDVKVPAQLLKQHGVIVFGIGVRQANLDELKFIATRPPEHFLFAIDSFQVLRRLTDSLLQTVCVSIVDQRQGKALDSRKHFIVVHFVNFSIKYKNNYSRKTISQSLSFERHKSFLFLSGE